jgi:hypothetical protein
VQDRPFHSPHGSPPKEPALFQDIPLKDSRAPRLAVAKSRSELSPPSF